MFTFRNDLFIGMCIRLVTFKFSPKCIDLDLVCFSPNKDNGVYMRLACSLDITEENNHILH